MDEIQRTKRTRLPSRGPRQQARQGRYARSYVVVQAAGAVPARAPCGSGAPFGRCDQRGIAGGRPRLRVQPGLLQDLRRGRFQETRPEARG